AHSVPFNPLFLYGGVGLGKTHLMHAIAWHVRMQAPGRKVIYLSAEKFMYQFIRALRFRSTMDFKDQFRSVDLLMIDDVQFISGKDSTQEEFFHTFNALVDQNRQIVISADKSPSDLAGLEERMRSRLGWGLVAEHFNIKMAEMTSSRRARAVARPRQVAMYLSKQLTSRSLPEIGRKFGGRDHTTVIHAVKKIEELIESDSALAEDVELLRRMLQS